MGVDGLMSTLVGAIPTGDLTVLGEFVFSEFTDLSCLTASGPAIQQDCRSCYGSRSSLVWVNSKW